MAPVRRHENGSLAVYDPRCSSVGQSRPWVVVYAPRDQFKFHYSQCLSDQDITGAHGWHLYDERKLVHD